MLASLKYHWRMNLAVAAGAAVAATVLTGALLVGDSVRGSLRDLTLERLGRIDHALTAPSFFSAAAVERLRGAEGFSPGFETAEGAILLRASVRHGTSGARASQVGLQGIGPGFAELFPGTAGELFPTAGGSGFPPAAINEALAHELGAAVGDQILVSLKRWSAVPRASILGRKETGEVIETLRLSVATILPDRGLGRFALGASQTEPLDVFVPLEVLQRRLEQEGEVNAVLVAASSNEPAEPQAARLGELLREQLELADFGLELKPGEGFSTLQSHEFVLRPAVAETATALAGELGLEVFPLQTYLVNAFRHEQAEVPYSTVTALDSAAPEVFGALRLTDGSPAPALGDGEILLDSWTVEELGVAEGATIELRYFVVGDREQLRETTTSFRVRGVLAKEGLAADPSLTQEYPGIGDAEHISDWDPPFPIDLGRIRTADEEYWDTWRGAPKAIVALATGQKLWATRWGALTGMRLAGDGDALERFRAELPRRLDPAAFGMVFEPVKARGLAASGGATDFGGLFIGFSLFLIVSAALLAALLFRLGVEQRAKEVGLLLAVGYPETKVRRQLLAEGLALSAAGALLGLAGAVGYAWLMMAGLRTWWLDAVGTSRLFLHVSVASLGMGWLISVIVVLLSIFFTVRRIAKVPAVRLLRGAVTTGEERARGGSKARWTAIVALALGAVLLVYAFASGETANPALFFAIGPALLVGLVAVFGLWLGREASTLEPGRSALARLGVGNCGRNPGRSRVSVTLVASAAFLVVTVAAYQQDPSREQLTRESGTGGFALVAESDVELHQDLASPEGRAELGLEEGDLAEATVVPLRRLPGDDTSCLNLYQPTRPRVLGVPPELIARGGFTFQKTLGEAPANPWELLEREIEPGVIPAIGDANSAQWILKLPLGADLTLEDDLGQPVRLRLVGMLATSIFQSELLISEANFVRHFPNHEGYGYFLIETPPAGAEALGQKLEAALAPYGFDATLAADKLAAFHQVQNTYLSTFQTLGGLGLLLGTVGLAVVLLRNVLERRGELATMRAFGFRRAQLRWMVVVENGLLLAVGLAIGTGAALVTVAPHLASEVAQVPWKSIAWTLASIFLFGLAACILSATGALRASLLPALKAEG